MATQKNLETGWKNFFGWLEESSDAVVDLNGLLQIDYWQLIVVPLPAWMKSCGLL